MGKNYTVTANNAGKWSFTVPETLRDGNYDYSISTVDKAGNLSPTITGTLTVDNSSVALTGGLDTTADPNIANGWSNHNDQTLKGTATPGATVIVTINGMTYTPIVTADGNWTLALPDLSNNSYSYTVTATNTAGTSSTISGQFVIDNTPPTTTVGLSAATDSGVLGDFITNNETPVFTGKTKPGATITLTIGGQTHTVVADNQGNWEVAVTTPLNTGTHNYTVSITDLAQNVSTPVNGELNIQSGNMAGLVTGGLDIDSNTGDTEIPSPVIQNLTFLVRRPLASRLSSRLAVKPIKPLPISMVTGNSPLPVHYAMAIMITLSRSKMWQVINPLR
ncbi:large repetitive protein [Salmonella enterica subsp. arizonae]|uniref:Large repetitive protein n=1 Tax=Salmonella enterica subsp. arizonae TaxID=59203 RepID=A0A2X4U4V0_SALER|nr:large repetitive protein [Salmonella enterica subsp. arizonae]